MFKLILRDEQKWRWRALWAAVVLRILPTPETSLFLEALLFWLIPDMYCCLLQRSILFFCVPMASHKNVLKPVDPFPRTVYRGKTSSVLVWAVFSHLAEGKIYKELNLAELSREGSQNVAYLTGVLGLWTALMRAIQPGPKVTCLISGSCCLQSTKDL